MLSTVCDKQLQAIKKLFCPLCRLTHVYTVTNTIPSTPDLHHALPTTSTHCHTNVMFHQTLLSQLYSSCNYGSEGRRWWLHCGVWRWLLQWYEHHHLLIHHHLLTTFKLTCNSYPPMWLCIQRCGQHKRLNMAKLLGSTLNLTFAHVSHHLWCSGMKLPDK